MFAVMTVGKVSARATARNAHEARNLATIACQGVIGMVSSSSSVPERRSSAHSRMPTAGTRTRYSQGCQPKKTARLASPLSKKLPAGQDDKPVGGRENSRDHEATRELEFPPRPPLAEGRRRLTGLPCLGRGRG